MAGPTVLVLRTGGINCDEEVMHCWRMAGARPRLVHLNRLVERPALLSEFAIVTIPGGFSYGDDIAAGVVFAQRIRTELADPFRRFLEGGGGLLGICNGFQILVKAGLLPGRSDGGNIRAVGARPRTLRQARAAVTGLAPGALIAGWDQVTITFNDSARFEARWVELEVCTERCPFLAPGKRVALPVEHAEGKVVTASEDVARSLQQRGLIALRYVDEGGRHDRYPANPNGSTGGIAGLCDETGRVLGLMPHPDRHFEHTHHPLWTRRNPVNPPDGLSVFQNAVTYWGR